VILIKGGILVSQLKYIVSLLTFIVISLVTSNTFADQLDSCPSPLKIIHSCQTYNKQTQCYWVTHEKGWEGDNNYTTDPEIYITGFMYAKWYGHYNQVNCVYMASNNKTVTLIPTWFGHTTPQDGDWMTYQLEDVSWCNGPYNSCTFKYQ
jgi:hypothetical protein